MKDIWKLKAVLNKKNKQVNVSIPKNRLPPHLKKVIGTDGYKILKMKFEGFEDG